MKIDKTLGEVHNRFSSILGCWQGWTRLGVWGSLASLPVVPKWFDPQKEFTPTYRHTQPKIKQHIRPLPPGNNPA